jgi:hypothetical protein
MGLCCAVLLILVKPHKRLSAVVACFGVISTFVLAWLFVVPKVAGMFAPQESVGFRVLSTALVLLNLTYCLILLVLGRQALRSGQDITELTNEKCLVTLAVVVYLAASYDLSYIHARDFSILFALLLASVRAGRLYRWLVGWIVLLLAAAGVSLNLPYFINLTDSLRSHTLLLRSWCVLKPQRASILISADVLETTQEFTRLAQERSGAVECPDWPGLAFLIDRYSSYQRWCPQYYWLMGVYPRADDAATGVVIAPLFDSDYIIALRKARDVIPFNDNRLHDFAVFGALRRQ